VRVFVGLWPPPPVLDALEALPRPDHPALRWTTRDQWHVTLRFLGELDEGVVTGLVERLEQELEGVAASDLTLGPDITWLDRAGRSPLVAPVTGADDLAASVAQAAGGHTIEDARPFRAHLTLARVRRGKVAPRGLAGPPLDASWVADRVSVVRSHLGADGARYETVAEIPLRAASSPSR
jgi:2'-5' RNA ligase